MKHITITGSECTILLTDVGKLDVLTWNILFDYRKKKKKRVGGDGNSW